jgi:hypothetical protein
MIVWCYDDKQLTNNIEPRTRDRLYPFAIDMALLMENTGIIELSIDFCQSLRQMTTILQYLERKLPHAPHGALTAQTSHILYR